MAFLGMGLTYNTAYVIIMVYGGGERMKAIKKIKKLRKLITELSKLMLAIDLLAGAIIWLISQF